MPNLVVNANYNTDYQNSDKMITLANGWRLLSLYDNNNYWNIIFKSTDNGVTWTQLCYVSSAIHAAIVNNGNTVVMFFMANNFLSVSSVTFDATTVTNIDLASTKVGASNSSSGQFNYPAMIIIGTTLWATWTYILSNSKNVFAASSTNNGASWSVYQVTSLNASGNTYEACTISNAGGQPLISAAYAATGSTFQMQHVFKFNGSSWSGPVTIYDSGTTAVSCTGRTTLLAKKSGSNINRLWMVIDGQDPVDTTHVNLRASWSDDNGSSWNTMFRVTTGNTYNRYKPILAEGPNGDVYLFYQADIPTASIVYRVCPNGSTSFGAETAFIASGSAPSADRYPSNGILGLAYADSSQVKFDKLVVNSSPNAPTPTAPTNGGFYNTVSSIPFSWNFSDPDVGDTQSAFYIETSTTSNFAAMEYNTGWVASSTQSYNWTGTWAQGVHYWRMYTKDAAGAQSPVSAVWSFTMDSVAPNAPTLTIGATTGKTVALSWTAPVDTAPSSGIANTYVYMRTWNGTSWVDIAGSPVVLAGAQTSYTYTGLVPNTLYHVIVQYRDNANNYGAYPEIPFITNIQQLFFSNPF